MRQWELRGVSTQVKRPVDEPVVMVEGPQGFRSLIDQVPAICWTTDADLRFTSALGAGWAELGLGPNQLVGTTLFDLLDTHDPREEPISAHWRALGGESVRFELWLGGRPFHGGVAPLSDARGHRIGTICVVLDGSPRPNRVTVFTSSLSATA